jgi:predicted membrane protein (TIGR00267 family)
MLGIVIGSWVVGNANPRIIVTAGFGACLAMGMSGIFGAYMAEKAERKRNLKELEDSMLTDLSDTLHGDASNFVSVYAGVIDGLSPMLTAVISLVPFVLTLAGALVIWDAYIISFALTLATLFSLGLYLGRIAKENVLLYGMQMVAAGLITAAIVVLLGGF